MSNGGGYGTTMNRLDIKHKNIKTSICKKIMQHKMNYTDDGQKITAKL